MEARPALWANVRPHLRRVVCRARRFRSRWYAVPVELAVLFALLLVLPFVLNVTVFGVPVGAYLSVQTLILALVWATAAQSWNMVAGYAGQFSFGHAAFFGLGAYIPILLIREAGVNPWIGLLVGALVASTYALAIGAVVFRYDIGGAYFALVTLAFAELLRTLFVNVSRLGGASGFVRPLPAEYTTDWGLIAFQFRSELHYYYLILVFLAVVTIVSLALRRSRLGLSLRAIRENERAAAALGVPTYRYKVGAFAASAFFTAWAGTFWAMYFSSIHPDGVFDLMVNLEILLPAVVGGFGTVIGPIVGSLVVTPAGEIARRAVDLPGTDWILYGVFLIAIALYSPRGVVAWPGRIVSLLGLDARTADTGTETEPTDSGEGEVTDGDEVTWDLGGTGTPGETDDTAAAGDIDEH